MTGVNVLSSTGDTGLWQLQYKCMSVVSELVSPLPGPGHLLNLAKPVAVGLLCEHHRITDETCAHARLITRTMFASFVRPRGESSAQNSRNQRGILHSSSARLSDCVCSTIAGFPADKMMAFIERST